MGSQGRSGSEQKHMSCNRQTAHWVAQIRHLNMRINLLPYEYMKQHCTVWRLVASMTRSSNVCLPKGSRISLEQRAGKPHITSKKLSFGLLSIEEDVISERWRGVVCSVCVCVC